MKYNLRNIELKNIKNFINELKNNFLVIKLNEACNFKVACDIQKVDKIFIIM